MSSARVEVTRGDAVESVHEVDVAVVEGERLVALAGSPDRVMFARSAVKPFQALPLVEDGAAERFGLTAEELALACASHSGEPRHVALAASILGKIGLDADALACGPHAPFDDDARDALRTAGEAPGRLHNNCSGKHAGMLALAASHGWPTAGYHGPDHPVQRRMLEEMERWTGEHRSGIVTGVDGCGVVTFALPLRGLATAFARLAAAVNASAPGSAPAAPAAPATVVRAMTAHPELVGGTGRLCTRLMQVTEGRVLAKVGAEGVYAAASLDRGLGIALKVRDGARRAAEVALLGVLEALGVLGADALDALADSARPAVRNTRGEVVGEVRCVVWLEASDG